MLWCTGKGFNTGQIQFCYFKFHIKWKPLQKSEYLYNERQTLICPLLNILHGITNGTMLHWRGEEEKKKKSATQQMLSKYLQTQKDHLTNSESIPPIYICLSYIGKGNVWLLQCSCYVEAAVIYWFTILFCSPCFIPFMFGDKMHFMFFPLAGLQQKILRHKLLKNVFFPASGSSC